MRVHPGGVRLQPDDDLIPQEPVLACAGKSQDRDMSPQGQGLDLLPFRSQVFDAITHTDVFC